MTATVQIVPRLRDVVAEHWQTLLEPLLPRAIELIDALTPIARAA